MSRTYYHKYRPNIAYARSFLLFTLALKEIQSYKNSLEMEESIEHIPRCTKDFFAHILSKIPLHNRAQVRLVLWLVKFSWTPLTCDQIADAVGLSTDEVLDVCPSELLTVDDDGTFHFVHFEIIYLQE